MDTDKNDIEKKEQGILSIPNSIVQIVQTITSIGGVCLALFSFVGEKPLWGAVGILVVLLSVFWHFYKKYKLSKRARQIDVRKISGDQTKTIARNLLPFKEGDTLLGRDNEIKEVITVVDSDFFQFGFIAGDAGVGKTSVIQAGVIPILKNQLGLTVIHVPRVKDDPNKEILNIVSKLGYLTTGVNDLYKVFIDIYQKEKKKIILIIDQFEEFFISFPSTDSRKPFVKEISECIKSEQFPFSILLSLRKEFVDDLNVFHPEIEQPTDINFRVRIDNWTLNEATSVFEQMVQLDGIPFSQELRESIVRDLATFGLVRPVEMQIVVAQLKEAKIYEFSDYKKKNRAHGILTDFIKSVIQPINAEVPETEVIVGKLLLRLLCNENTDTKRTVGLNIDELITLIKQEVIRRKEWKFFENDNKLIDALNNTIQRCLKQKVIIYEDSNAYNLAHDYIVQPIRDATKDIETLEQQANRVLDKFVHTSYTYIPYKQLRFIKKYASKSFLTEFNSRVIIKKSQQRVNMYLVGGVLFFLFSLTLISYLTKRDVYIVEEINNVNTKDKYFAFNEYYNYIFCSQKDSLIIIDLNSSSSKIISKSYLVPERNFLSEDNQLIGGMSKSSQFNLWKITKSGVEKIKLNLDNDFYVESINENWIAGYSQDSVVSIYDIDKSVTYNFPFHKFFPPQLPKQYLSIKDGDENLPITPDRAEEKNKKKYISTSIKLSNGGKLSFNIVKHELINGSNWQSHVGNLNFDIRKLIDDKKINLYIDSLENPSYENGKLPFIVSDGYINKYNGHKSDNNEIIASFIPSLTSFDSSQKHLNGNIKFLISNRYLDTKNNKPFFYSSKHNFMMDSLYFKNLDNGNFEINPFGSVLVSNDNSYVIASTSSNNDTSIQIYKLSQTKSEIFKVKSLYTDYKDSVNYFYSIEKDIGLNKILITVKPVINYYRSKVISYLLDVSNFDSIKYYKLESLSGSDRDYNFYLLSPNEKYILSFDESGIIKVKDIKDNNSKDLIKFDVLGGHFSLNDCYWSKTSDYIYVVFGKEIAGGFISNGNIEQFNIHTKVASEIQEISVSADKKSLWVMDDKNLYKVTKKTYIWGFIPIKDHRFPDINYSLTKRKIFPRF